MKKAIPFMRKLLGISIPIVAMIFVLNIPLYLTGVSFFNQQYLALFWALVAALIFLTIPASKDPDVTKVKWHDLLLAGLTICIGLYVTFFYAQILLGLGVPTTLNSVLGFLAILVTLESVRRVTGWTIVIIILVFILYAKFGYLVPGVLRIKGLSWSRLFNQLYLGSDFMFGTPLRVTGLMVFGFIFFGNVIMRTGGGEFLFDIAQSLMGRFRGGPAKGAVLASTFFGTLSGSAVANVAGTGMVTIPLMKRVGYSSTYAGAIEATASTGGQILPPVMGAAAFVMAEFLGVPYRAVVVAALIPALLYYLGVFLQIDLQAAKMGLKGLPDKEIPSFKKTIREGWIYLIPLFVLVITLFVFFMPPGVAALYSAGAMVIATLLKKKSRAVWSWEKVSEILERTSKTLFEVTAISAAAGFVVGIVGYTGLGLSLSRVLTEAAGGSLFLLALLTAVTSTILGMGMPTTAAYILLAVLAAPALTNLGIEPIVAHLFIFYFGTFSMITPPVCLAVYTAGSIAKASPMPLAFRAMKLAIAGYVVPFVFLYAPGLAFIGSWKDIIANTVAAVIAITMMAVGLEGFLFRTLKRFERVIYLTIGILIIVPSWWTRILGLALLCINIFLSLLKRKGS